THDACDGEHDTGGNTGQSGRKNYACDGLPFWNAECIGGLAQIHWNHAQHLFGIANDNRNHQKQQRPGNGETRTVEAQNGDPCCVDEQCCNDGWDTGQDIHHEGGGAAEPATAGVLHWVDSGENTNRDCDNRGQCRLHQGTDDGVNSTAACFGVTGAEHVIGPPFSVKHRWKPFRNQFPKNKYQGDNCQEHAEVDEYFGNAVGGFTTTRDLQERGGFSYSGLCRSCNVSHCTTSLFLARDN